MSFETTSNLLTLNNDPFPTTTNTNTTTTTTTAASDAKHVSKLILRSALQKANAAVQCDSTNDVLGAINAYKEAISLLERVLSTVEKENDRQRLQSIHDSYSERIRLLSTITSKLETDMSTKHQVEEQEEHSPTQDTEKPWLAKKSSIRSFSSRQSINTATNSRPSHAMMLRKMTSSSSMEGGSIHEKSPPARNHWQDNTPSPSTRPVSQKEMPKFPVSPPIFQMQASKSTPTHPHHRNRTSSSSRQHKQSHYDAEDEDEEEDTIDLDSDEFDLERDEYNLLGPHEPLPAKPSHCHSNSNRSSVSSVDSVLSSQDSLVEQPAMNLPSLKNNNNNNKDHDTTPIPKVRSVFRARTSSLPKAPVMQRSSSMSTVDTIASPTTEDNNKQQPITIDTTPPSHSQTYPAQMIVNRPIISRPSVGGLGSMRKKAANRLSMDGFTISRAKEKLSNSPSAGSNTYGNFLKDHIQPVAADDMEYIMDNSTAIQDDVSPHVDSSNEDLSLQDGKPSNSSNSSSSSHLKLLLALEKSMLEGAHITQRLYIPKSLWQQPNIRLSSMDIKVSACESLLTDIARLENWSYLDDLISSTRLLDHFETSVDHLQMTLSKKLKRDSIIESNSSGSSQLSHSGSIHHSSSRDSISMSRMDSGKKTQSFMSWGTKLTKSVERMNAFSLTKTEDQYKNYIDVLQKLFAKIHVLEHWLSHYHAEKQKSRQVQHDVLITKLIKICTVINTVIGGFVVRDITVLLAKWLKRGGSWVNE